MRLIQINGGSPETIRVLNLNRQRIISPRRWERFSLSLGEMAGVRAGFRLATSNFRWAGVRIPNANVLFTSSLQFAFDTILRSGPTGRRIPSSRHL